MPGLQAAHESAQTYLGNESGEDEGEEVEEEEVVVVAVVVVAEEEAEMADVAEVLFIYHCDTPGERFGERSTAALE